MRKKWCICILLIVFTGGCATTQLTTSQRRELEGERLQGTYENAFKATMQVLQDREFVIENADFKTGVIQGKTPIKQGFWGVMRNSEATATLERFGEDTVKERIVITNKVKTSTQYGTNENSKRVEDPQVFKKIYEDIQKEIFVRQNLSK